MDSLRLHVQVEEADADPGRVDDLTRSLRRELLAADVERVDPVSDGPAPAGTRGLDAVTIGSLLVATSSSALAATQAITAIRGWVSRTSKDCTVKISVGDFSLTLPGAATPQQQQLVAEFVAAVLPAQSDDAPPS